MGWAKSSAEGGGSRGARGVYWGGRSTKCRPTIAPTAADRANVGAMGEAKEHQAPLAVQLAACQRFSIVINEFEFGQCARLFTKPQPAFEFDGFIAVYIPGQAKATDQGKQDDAYDTRFIHGRYGVKFAAL